MQLMSSLFLFFSSEGLFDCIWGRGIFFATYEAIIDALLHYCKVLIKIIFFFPYPYFYYIYIKFIKKKYYGRIFRQRGEGKGNKKNDWCFIWGEMQRNASHLLKGKLTETEHWRNVVRQMTAIKALVQRISAFLDYGDIAKTSVIHILSNAGVFEFIVGIIFFFSKPMAWQKIQFKRLGFIFYTMPFSWFFSFHKNGGTCFV